MKKIGIYAGSFDPVHNGHIAFALKSIEQCKLDKIFFLPEPRPRYKQGVKALEHRLAMVKLAIEKHSELGVIEADHGRFTVNETLPALQARFGGADLYFLLGDDKLKRLVNWPNVGTLTNQVKFIIGARQKNEEDVRRVAELITASGGPKFQYSFVELKDKKVSSSDVRKQLRYGKNPNGISAPVFNYIRREGLYSTVDQS